MPEGFAGLSVLLTGAASGLGAAAARAFAGQGARLTLVDLDPGVESVAAPLGARAIVADVSDEAAARDMVAAALDAHGRIDVAVNNAGIGGAMAPLTAIPVEDFDRIMAVNARGVFLGMKHQLPPMIEAGKGAILNVASAAGLVGAGRLAAYAASKHAVVGLTRSAADEVARHGIRVNALCPSFTATPLFEAMADGIAERHGVSRGDATARTLSRVPMGRIAAPGEIVQAMLWACAPDNTFFTGQALALDGGLTAV